MRHPTLILFFVAGCAAAPGAVGNAIANTAVAATASAISRASGGCYAACPVGTRCDNSTGYCESIPCRDLCSTDEDCLVTALTERCVPKAAATLKLHTGEPAAPAPIDPK